MFALSLHVGKLCSPLVLVGLAGWALGSAGCLGGRRMEPPTQSDRLMQAYPDLRSGRFAVIADFERPEQMELFRLIGVSPGARFRLDPKRGQEETGRTCLAFHTESPDDTLVINNERARAWYLKRDWQGFDLLLLSVFNPAGPLTLRLSLRGGEVTQSAEASTTLPLANGWNLLRLDLGEIAEAVPIDDVREMAIAISGAAKGVELCFDDLLLAGNRRDLFGDSQARDGKLYVQLAGRRVRIGAGGAWEVTFSNGQIVAWHNLAADPHRIHNLVAGATLGPTPIVLAGSDQPASDFRSFGEAVVAHPRLLEASKVRVRLQSEWRFVDAAGTSLANRPFQRWTYTFYPGGQVYVDVECTVPTGGSGPRPLGLAVTLSMAAGDSHRTIDFRERADHQASEPVCYAWARSASQGASLLYVLGSTSGEARMNLEQDNTVGRVTFVAAQPPGHGVAEHWRCHLLLGHADEAMVAQAPDRAADYASPARLRVDLGSAAAPGGQLYDAGEGCYVIAPQDGQVRLMLDGRERPRFSPAFKVLNAGASEAWVYVNSVILDDVSQDADGNLVFQLAGVLQDETLIEVLSRRNRNGVGP